MPRATEEIVACARACLDAGAADRPPPQRRGPARGRHASEPYREAWTRDLRARTPTPCSIRRWAAAGRTRHIRERYAHVEELADAGLLRLAIIDPGSVSASARSTPKACRRRSISSTRTPSPTCATWPTRCRERGLAVHVSIFEPGFLRVALAYHAAGRLPPAKIQLYFGGPALPFGLPPTAPSLDAYLAMLEGSGLPWMVGVLGGDVDATLAELAIERGGHVRVGLEDYAGRRQPRNEELVAEIVKMAKRPGARSPRRPKRRKSSACRRGANLRYSIRWLKRSMPFLERLSSPSLASE